VDKIVVHRKNHAYLHIETTVSVEAELQEHFCFFVPGYKFTPAYKKKYWDGKYRIYNFQKKELPIGLFPYLVKFAKERDYEMVEEDSDYGPVDTKNNLDLDSLVSFVKYLNITSKGREITAREYQIRGILHAINNKNTLLMSPTASGKSLIIYIILRWYLQTHNAWKKILIVVPTTSLVEQMYSDFADYSAKDDTWDIEDNVHRIYQGHQKNTSKGIVITTWQSIFKMPSKWFEDYGMIVGDEAHTFKAKSLISIMSKLRDADMRIGTTGTVPDASSECHRLILEGHFGPIYKVVTTKQLMDAGTLAALEINVLLLEYPEEIRHALKKATYHEEIEFLVSNTKRNNFIKNLALDQDGNTLVLFNLVQKHGIPLYNLINDSVKTERKVFFVSGETPTDDRERIRLLTEQEKNAIIVASLGTFSTGVNIKNLHNIIFASPSKSQIKVLQSIGRGLRKSTTGQETQVFDIADDLHFRKRKNYTLNHSADRIKIYAREKFTYDFYKVQL
jgi:superfamily II DNA or RNA helicase